MEDRTVAGNNERLREALGEMRATRALSTILTHAPARHLDFPKPMGILGVAS